MHAHSKWNTTFETDTISCQAVLKQRHSRILSTQIVEDAFNRQKRQKARHMNRRLKAAGAWDVLQEKHLVDSVHHYTSPASHSPPEARRSSLPMDTFQGPRHGTSMAFEGIASFKAQSDWYSPMADRHGVQYADVQLTKYAFSARSRTSGSTSSCRASITSCFERSWTQRGRSMGPPSLPAATCRALWALAGLL